MDLGGPGASSRPAKHTAARFSEAVRPRFEDPGVRSTLRMSVGVAIWAGVTAAAIAGGDGRGGWWEDMPVLAGIVSGTLLFALAAFVVNQFIEDRAASRWERIAKVGYIDLALETRDAVALLWGLHSSRDLSGETRHIHLDLTPARELRSEPPGKNRVAALDNPDLPAWDPPLEAVLPRARLEQLLKDRQWLDFAHLHVEALHRHTKAVTKDWASHMIWASRPRSLLNHFAEFSDQITKLDGTLNILRGNLGEPVREANNRERVLRRWLLTDVKGRILLNALWEHGGWRQRMHLPAYALGVSVDYAFSNPDAIGAFRHPVPPIAEDLS